LGVASQRLVHIQEHGVEPPIFCAPLPPQPGLDVADDRLTALGDVNMLNGHLLLAPRAGGRPANRLLSGDDIGAAKAWAARRPKNAPELTELQLDFIKASEVADS
jgi:hypothetical protein